MSLTWKDALATVAAGANVAVYVAFLRDADVPIIDSTRGATAAILTLGVLGGCMLSAAPDAFQRGRGPYLGLASLLGATALIAGLAALIMDSALALAVLFYATIALWFIATLRHAFTSQEMEAIK